MDDLVVIILTLLIAGAGAIGQMKKKKQVPVASEAPKKPESFWDLLADGALLPEPELKTEPDYDNFEPEESEPFVNEQDYNFEAKNEGGVLINKEMNIQPVSKIKAITKKEKFPLRKAVIYSEILNRKYT